MKTLTISLFVLLALGTTKHTNAQTSNAINLTGTNYVDAGSTLNATNIKTLECWVKFNNFTGTQEILSRSTNAAGIELLVYNNTLAFFCMQSGSNTSNVSYPTSNLTAGVWYHIAATWDGTKESMSIYVNGVKVSGAPSNVGNINTNPIVNPSGTFRIGQWSDAGSTRYLNGTVDEVRIWSINRTASEIKNGLYNPVATNTPGLLAYYNFNEASGTAVNATGNTAFDGILMGSPSRVPSPIQITPNALVFDGVDDLVTAPANSLYDLTNGTVEFWVRSTNLAAHPTLQQYLVGVRGATLTRFSFHMSPTQVGLWNGTNYKTLAYTFTDNNWYHLAFVMGASSTEVYVNGVDRGAIAEGPGTQTGQPLTMGYTASTGEALTGTLDEVRIWNVQRTATEISSNMGATLTGSESGLVGLFSFNQGSAGGSNSGLTYAIDGTSNNNHGVLTSFSLSGTTSNYTLSSTPTLPVIFSYFTGLSSNGASLLRWQTAQEENSSFFGVERSTDNRSWVEIGRVTAAGNSSLPKSYSFTDETPAPGNNFYRIRETDLDGRFMYSSLVVLNYSTSTHPGIRIYPNPARQTLNYVVTSAENTRGQAQITDLSGRLVISSPVQLSAGLNSLSLEIGGLIPGVYVLRLVPQTGEPYYSRFQVIR